MIPVYRAAQIRAADEYTIIHTPIASIDLMEKAARACTDKILEIIPKSTTGFIICCGPGNNGGDGLAIARMLLEKAFQVKVVLVGKSDNAADHQLNKRRLLDLQPDAILESFSSLNLSSRTILIDALFGTGLNKAPSGDYSNCIQWMNQQQVTRISIDIPSGLLSDTITHHAGVVQAHHTLSFEFYKPGFLFAESGAACGIIHILSIGLLTHEAGLGQPYALMLEASDFRTLLSGRSLFAHKGDFGKVLLV
ncbi:MAG: NAD(P)H-hydrate epimerase, partial [Chitinophagaceae bacterium]|nr:NAD(P)H-hydrate epimerase [Chitinophagaceae bacterium]